jgi:hypothetical protein
MEAPGSKNFSLVFLNGGAWYKKKLNLIFLYQIPGASIPNQKKQQPNGP